VQGENFHLVGQTMSFNLISQSPSSAYGTATPEAAKQGTSTNEPVNIDANQVDNNEANRQRRKDIGHLKRKRDWYSLMKLTNCFLNLHFIGHCLVQNLFLFLHFLILYFVGQFLVECF
jgi:hypothetical protein